MTLYHEQNRPLVDRRLTLAEMRAKDRVVSLAGTAIGISKATASLEKIRAVGPYGTHAALYHRLGYGVPLPVPHKDKYPPPPGCTGGDPAVGPDKLAEWIVTHDNYDIALRVPVDMVVLDLDMHTGKTGRETLAEAERRWGPLPLTYMATARDDGSGRGWYYLPVGCRSDSMIGEIKFTLQDGRVVRHIDVLRFGHRYSMVAPSLHHTGKVNIWLNPQGKVCDAPLLNRDNFPELPQAWFDGLQKAEPQSDVGEWTWALETCWWWKAKVDRWPTTDEPRENSDWHNWFYSQSIKLNDGHRNGCLTEAGYAEAEQVLVERFKEGADKWMAQEISHTLADAVKTAASHTDAKVAEELSFHAHAGSASSLGYPDWPDQIKQAAAADPALAEAIRRQANAERAKLALIEREEWRLDRKPLDIATLSELLLRDAPPWRIRSAEKASVPGTGDGLIPADSRTLIAGAAKIGKTTLLGNLTQSLLTGKPFLGHYDEIRPVEGSIVVLNYEVSGPTYARWLNDMQMPDDERLHVVSLRGVPNPFSSERNRAELVNVLQERNCEVLIVDPFSRAFVSKNQNQNDVGEVAKWLGILDEVADSAGVKEIILSAHTGWNGERTRGSSGLHDWPDVIVTMKIEDGDRFLSAEGRDVQLAESQLLWFPEHRHLRMVPGNRATVKAEKKLGGLVDAVVEIVTETPGLGTNEIVTVLKNQGSPARRADIGAALNRACGRGLIEVRLEANRKQAHYLTDAASVVSEGSK